MWQRFDESVRKVIFYAQEEAQRIGDRRLDPEHLLLGMTREGGCVASKILGNLGTSAQAVYQDLSARLPRSPPGKVADMTLSSLSKRVIDCAYEEARGLNHNYIGTEHLLLGLLRQSDVIAAEILEKHGVELIAARSELLALVGKGLASIPDPREAQERDIAKAWIILSKKLRMQSDQLCLMFMFEVGGYAESAVLGCGAFVESLAQIIEDEILSANPVDQGGGGVLNASQLMHLAILEAHTLGQVLNSSHFLLASLVHGSNATARAMAFYGISVGKLSEWVSTHP